MDQNVMTLKQLREREGQNSGVMLRNLILGGQDGLVNVLGLVLGVAAATQDTRLILIAGLAGTFAESISMAAVAYTSSKAARDFYYSELERERREMEETPLLEIEEIEDIYKDKGFKGQLLKDVVKKITSNKKVWLETMMTEELRLFPDEWETPGKDAWVVGLSAVVGSFIPLLPFFFVPVQPAIFWAIVISALTLFITGAYKAKITIGNPLKAGFEMTIIGMAAALIGFLIGYVLGIIL